MNDAPLLLIVEDNIHNLKLARDVLGHAATRRSRRATARRRSRWPARSSRT